MGDKLVRFKKQTAEDMELDELLRSLSRTQREIDLASNAATTICCGASRSAAAAPPSALCPAAKYEGRKGRAGTLNIAEQFFIAIAVLFLALIAFKLFSAPLRLALRVGANTALGFLALIALDLFSPLLGLHIAVNLVNALIVGILGLPGLALLVLMQWVFL